MMNPKVTGKYFNPSFTRIGVGFTSNGYWTQMFIG